MTLDMHLKVKDVPTAELVGLCDTVLRELERRGAASFDQAAAAFIEGGCPLLLRRLAEDLQVAKRRNREMPRECAEVRR